MTTSRYYMEAKMFQMPFGTLRRRLQGIVGASCRRKNALIKYGGSSGASSKTIRLDWRYLNVEPFVKIDHIVHAGGKRGLLRFDCNRVDGEAVHEQLLNT